MQQMPCDNITLFVKLQSSVAVTDIIYDRSNMLFCNLPAGVPTDLLLPLVAMC